MKRDCIVFDVSTSKRRIDENGFLYVEANPVSKAQVSPYYGAEINGWEDLGLEPERVYHALRAEESLAEAAHTFNGLPLLLGHYPESAEQPQKEHRVGSLGTDAVFIRPYLRVTLIITDQQAIDAITSGTAKELSAGYAFDPELSSGEYQGEKYDFIMKNIRGNHVALVEEGRAGPDVRVQDAKNTQKRGVYMKTKKSVLDWARRILRLARDVDPGIEPDELEAAKEILAVNKDEDTAAKIQKIMALLPDLDEAKAKELATALQELTGGAADEETTGDEDPKATDNEAKDEDPTATDAEEVKAALNACGLDSENAEVQKAFAEGMKHAEKQAGVADEDPAKAKDSDTPEEKKALDAALRRMGKGLRRAPARAADVAIDHMRALNAAARHVRPIMGEIVDPLAFDSAEAVYGKALDLAGINKAAYPRSSWRGMCDMLLRGGAAPAAALAHDAKAVDGPCKHLGNIRVEG